ncbi:MAG: hypothetical protein ACHP84_05235 [Caulobacterales bacterium]
MTTFTPEQVNRAARVFWSVFGGDIDEHPGGVLTTAMRAALASVEMAGATPRPDAIDAALCAEADSISQQHLAMDLAELPIGECMRGNDGAFYGRVDAKTVTRLCPVDEPISYDVDERLPF